MKLSDLETAQIREGLRVFNKHTTEWGTVITIIDGFLWVKWDGGIGHHIHPSLFDWAHLEILMQDGAPVYVHELLVHL
jgi:hypothetical protein